MINIITGADIITVSFKKFWELVRVWEKIGFHLESLTEKDKTFYNKFFIHNPYFTVMLCYW